VKKQRLFVILLSVVAAIFYGCEYDLLNQERGFKRLLKGAEEIEAVDFIIKPDNEGYLVLGNSKVNGNLNSSIILFNLSSDGLVESTTQINTTFNDSGTKLYLTDNNRVLILGQRDKLTDGSYSILLSTDIEANPVLVNDSAAIRELKYQDESLSLHFKDLMLIGNDLVLSGFLTNASNNTNKITQVFDLNNVLNISEVAIPKNQIPVESAIEFDNSKSHNLLRQTGNDDIFIIGERFLGNIGNRSLNVSIDLIDNLNSGKPLTSPTLAAPGDQFLKASTLGNNEGEFFFGGISGSAINDPDSLFILSATYFKNATNDNADIAIRDLNILTTYGNNLTDIIQLSDGNVLVVTNEAGEIGSEEIMRSSSILKFSFFVAGNPASELELVYNGNGNYDIKKIMEENNQLVVLSTIAFGTGETAIEIAKIDF